MHFHGQILVTPRHRTDIFSLSPLTSKIDGIKNILIISTIRETLKIEIVYLQIVDTNYY